VESLGKAAEKGVGDLASNVMNRINGANTPKSSEKRRTVSASIERKVKSFEQDENTTGSEEIPLERKKSQDSFRLGSIHKKASEEHNKLRQMFEDGNAFGRSVAHSNENSSRRTKINPADSRSRSQSAEEDGNGGGREAVVEEESPMEKIDRAKDADKLNQSGEVAVDNKDKGHEPSEETQEIGAKTKAADETKTNKQDVHLPNDPDINDPFLDSFPKPPQLSSTLGFGTNSSTSSVDVANPVLKHPSTHGPRSSSPTRPSKIPKLVSKGSPPKKSVSPVKSLLAPAPAPPTTAASTSDVYGAGAAAANGIQAGGARERGK
jgi:hypothetical protein